MRWIIGLGLGLLAAAVLGAVIALAGASLTGHLGQTKTVRVVEATPIAAGPGARSSALSTPAIYKRDAPGVVQITSTSVVNVPSDPFFTSPTQKQTQEALGSGFVIDKEGHIVTNYHVVEGASSIKVSFSNNETHKATIVGSDRSTDIAVLKVNVSSSALNPLQFGDSSTLQVGDQVVAIGNPFGLTRTATQGIISALNRPLSAPNNFTIANVIQTDAQINHGNSGGPLLSALGQVIGVNTAIETGGTSQGNVGIGFAIPSNTVKTVVAQLISTGKAVHPYLGVTVEPLTPELARLFHLPVSSGLLVDHVFSKTGAAKAGIKGGTTTITVAGESYRLGGDIIVAVDGKKVGSSFEKLSEVIAAHRPGDKVPVELYRGEKKMTVSVELGTQPAQAPS